MGPEVFESSQGRKRTQVGIRVGAVSNPEIKYSVPVYIAWRTGDPFP
jgi:hypothetical protein